MPRTNRCVEGFMGRACKIRKRGCSSSSSSSVLQSYRFKRAILVGKRGGSSTPVPTWKMTTRSPSSTVDGTDSTVYQPLQTGVKIAGAPVSARKLAATLWEMNEIPSPRMKEERAKKDVRGKDGMTRSVRSERSLPRHLSDPSHSPVSDRIDRSGTANLRRRMAAIPQRYGFNDRHNGGVSDSHSSASLMEIETRSRGLTPTGSLLGVKSRLKDLSNGLTTSKELLKILNRMWGLEEQHSSSKSLVSALHIELERAQLQVDRLSQEQKSDRNEINYLKKHFAEEKAAWKSKEQEKIRAAIQCIMGELEVERKLRRTECLNKKLSKELAATKASLSKALKELESQSRAREIMEQVCDELARGIGEDKAEVEELKRESAKVWEEVEKEREMLQLADIWREERVQMKLSEAKFQFEEKNAAVDKLRNELEAFLNAKRTKELGGGYRNCAANIKIEEQQQLSNLSQTHMGSDRSSEGEEVDGEEEEDRDDDGSAESDLHSIELNMDNNCKSYRWNYAAGAVQEDSRMPLVEDAIKGSMSASERILRGASSLDRGVSDGIGWDFDTKDYQHRGEEPDQGRFFESNGPIEKVVHKQDSDDEPQRYKSMKGLRDHILSGSRIASPGGFVSSTGQWSQRWHSQESGDTAHERLKVAEMVKGMRETGPKARLLEGKGEGQILRHKQLQIAAKH